MVERFDKVYGEALTPIFVHGLQVAIDGNEEEKKKCYSISEANIPDTDEFSEEEGAYAQNAMISLYYFLGNALSEDGASIQGAIGLMLENLDLLNYESDHNYDQSTMILNEITVVLDMISVIVRAPSSDATLANSTARGYML
ncbi:hypothetical protein [Pseudomonas eucalypticola]|uniref:Uncharacterized protein n=1 Tax=Pseudomonas eucalypticola TaxID=2599595 RepID=A0A7D5D4G7_9PSED|nr:hypothetical protein [Pseudomonas eucalypticola]QKZ02415.1 hypothetical protein HWQ56_00855 [Pseudomonas eucalypticola]